MCVREWFHCQAKKRESGCLKLDFLAKKREINRVSVLALLGMMVSSLQGEPFLSSDFLMFCFMNENRENAKKKNQWSCKVEKKFFTFEQNSMRKLNFLLFNSKTPSPILTTPLILLVFSIRLQESVQ
jgi:hypothetical protein